MVDMQQDEKECPFCAELIKAEAVKCKHCGSMLNNESIANAMPKARASSTGVLQEQLSSDLGREIEIARPGQKWLFIAAGGFLVVIIAVTNLGWFVNQRHAINSVTPDLSEPVASAPDSPPTVATKSTQSNDAPDSDQGKLHNTIAYKNFWLGMKLEEFESLPLPNSKPFAFSKLIKEEHPDIKATFCHFDDADLTISNNAWAPVFYFSDQGKGLELIGIEGECSKDDVEKIGAALAYKYGNQNGGHNCWYFSTETAQPLENASAFIDACAERKSCYFITTRKALPLFNPNSKTSEEEDTEKAVQDFTSVLNGDESHTRGLVQFYKYPAMCDLTEARKELDSRRYKQLKQEHQEQEHQSHSADARDL